MHPAPHGTSLRRNAARVTLGLLILASALVLTQCKLVEDTLTGVKVTPERARSCLNECQRSFQEAMEEERETHRRNLEQCEDEDGDGGDRGGRNDCRDRERERHREALRNITEALKRCVSGCHHQGGGRGR